MKWDKNSSSGVNSRATVKFSELACIAHPIDAPWLIDGPLPIMLLRGRKEATWLSRDPLPPLKKSIRPIYSLVVESRNTSGHTAETFSEEVDVMAEGTIKKLTDKGFGFIDTGGGKDLFFHNSSLDGVSYDDLREGDRVSFTEASGQKGPCAEDVKVI